MAPRGDIHLHNLLYQENNKYTPCCANLCRRYRPVMVSQTFNLRLLDIFRYPLLTPPCPKRHSSFNSLTASYVQAKCIISVFIKAFTVGMSFGGVHMQYISSWDICTPDSTGRRGWLLSAALLYLYGTGFK